MNRLTTPTAPAANPVWIAKADVDHCPLALRGVIDSNVDRGGAGGHCERALEQAVQIPIGERAVEDKRRRWFDAALKSRSRVAPDRRGLAIQAPLQQARDDR